jgi:hypothetical protein
MNCPSCGSNQCQRLEMIYDAGTKLHSSSFAGIGAIGRNIGVSGGRSTGVSRSIQAIKISPPVARSMALPALIFLIGMILLPNGNIVLAGLLFVGGGLVLFFTGYYNQVIHPKIFSAWRGRWMCNQCGMQYDPQGSTTPISESPPLKVSVLALAALTAVAGGVAFARTMSPGVAINSIVPADKGATIAGDLNSATSDAPPPTETNPAPADADIAKVDNGIASAPTSVNSTPILPPAQTPATVSEPASTESPPLNRNEMDWRKMVWCVINRTPLLVEQGQGRAAIKSQIHADCVNDSVTDGYMTEAGAQAATDKMVDRRLGELRFAGP